MSERVERRVRKFVEGVERENLPNFPDLLGFVANLHNALPSLMRSTALYLAAHGHSRVPVDRHSTLYTLPQSTAVYKRRG